LLEELNQERQAMEKTAIEEVSAMAGTGRTLPKAICLCSERWHVGVIGIVASRLVDTYHRPAAIIALRGDRGRGSVRSIPGFPVNRVLERCAHLLEGFGGHPLAAGFTILRENVSAFSELFQAEAGALLGEENFIPELAIDGEVSLGELSLKLAAELKMLEPYGLGNPEPVLAARDLQVMQYPRRVGNDHLKMKVRGRGKVMEAIGFGMGRLLEDLQGFSGGIDLAFCAGINIYCRTKISLDN
jgi:single-stranded-DNA-specific exonuclease